MNHGTVYSYENGCHCELCREAKREKRRRQYREARAEGRASYRNELASSRARKEHHRGTCEDCGGPTSWAGGAGKPKTSPLCVSCSRKRKEAQHGTPSKYSHGCHCEACTAAHRERMRAYRAARRAQLQSAAA